MASGHVDEDTSTWYDKIVTPLNACSLETFAPISDEPGLTPKGDGKTTGTSSGPESSRGDVIPLVIGCYQLNEQSSKELLATEAEDNDTNSADDDVPVEKKSSRSGELRLYMIPSTSPATSNDEPDNDGKANNEDLRFNDAECVIQMESGVLDGKWRKRWKPDQSSIDSDYEAMPLFASACASGRIHLHSLEKNNLLPSQPWRLSPVASTNETSSADGTSLCLSLAWNDFINCYSDNSPNEDEIVSSYSDGTVALHKFSCGQSEMASEEMDSHGGNSRYNNISIEETHRWNAHSMFGCPAEVWTCSFLRNDKNVVLSGADDCSLKIWDIRQTQRPTHKIGDSEFEAGVTAISPHPGLNHIFAVGSYDEYVRIYDHRNMNQPMAKVCVGGGVWRIKWHPSSEEYEPHGCGKMLVAAMHGGCRVVNFTAWDSPSDGSADTSKMLAKFTAHESMAYGADWVWFGQDSCEAAASCSFYDQQAFLWDPYKQASKKVS